MKAPAESRSEAIAAQYQRPPHGTIQKSALKNPVQKCQSAPAFPTFFIFPEPNFAQHFGLIGQVKCPSVLAIAKHKNECPKVSGAKIDLTENNVERAKAKNTEGK